MNLFLALQFVPPDISFALIAPELIVCAVAVLVMLVDAFARPFTTLGDRKHLSLWAGSRRFKCRLALAFMDRTWSGF